MEILVVCVNSPIYCGIYENKNLIKSISFADKTSFALSKLQIFLNKEFNLDSLPNCTNPNKEESTKTKKLESIYYACGPGNLTAIKLAHIFLHTLSAIHNIPLFACDSFYIFKDTPIHAFSNRYFYKENDEIKFSLLESKVESSLQLPKILDSVKFNLDTKPNYLIPAI